MLRTERDSRIPLKPALLDAPFWVRAVVIGALIAVFTVFMRGFVLEDGLIYARFVANALHGLGLVFNPGEHVNALTSPLFSYVLLATSWMLRGNVLAAEHLLFAVTFFGACLLAEEMVPLSGLLIAATAYFYTLIGMETSLFLLLVMAVVKAYQTRRYEWLPLLVVLATLARFEAGLLIPLVAWALWRERRFPKPVWFVPPVLLIVLYLVANHHWYGAWLPNSATSKLGQGRSGLWGEWPWAFLQLRGWALVPGGAFWRTMWMLPALLVLAVFGWDRMRRMRAGRVLTPFTAGLFAFYVLFNIPAYHWYWAPFVFLLIVYGLLGVPRSRVAQGIVCACIVASAVLNGAGLRGAGLIQDYVNVANWMNANTPPDATVESVEIGTIGWFTHRKVIDILGLTDRKNSEHVAHGDTSSWFWEDQPDYVVVHRPLLLWEQPLKGAKNYREAPFHSGSVYVMEKVKGRE